MSLFVSEETVRLYVKDGRIVEEETPDWIEVLKEPPAGLVEQAIRAIRPKELYFGRDGSARFKLDEVENIPLGYLASVIKGWSEPVPVNVENLQRLPYRLLRAIWEKVQEMHGLAESNASSL